MTDQSIPQVVGLDLSVTGTGIAAVDGTVSRFTPRADGKADYGLARLTEVRDAVRAATDATVTEMAFIEGLAFDAHDRDRQLAQLAGMVRADLYDRGVPFLLVTPGTLKRYATGSGNATKTEVLLAARDRLGYDGSNYDEADALWLRAVGCDVLEVPLVSIPARQRDALAQLRRTRPAMKEARS